MLAILKKYIGTEIDSEEIVSLPDNYDGDPYGDTVPFTVASNWSLQPLEDVMPIRASDAMKFL